MVLRVRPAIDWNRRFVEIYDQSKEKEWTVDYGRIGETKEIHPNQSLANCWKCACEWISIRVASAGVPAFPRSTVPDDSTEVQTRAMSMGVAPGRALPREPGARLRFRSPGFRTLHNFGRRHVTLFQNVRIFDGKSAALSAPSNVLVSGNTIERISASPITVDANATSASLRRDGRVLMPGLIDAHWHAFMAATPQMLLMTADPSYLHLLAARQAEATLMRGFTTVRDLGGPVFGLKRAIDEGVMIGPRIYPSGAFISQTSGHGDFRFPLRASADAGRSAEPLRGRGRRSHCRQPR